MPWSAVPDHLNPHINPTAWKGTDQDVWWKRWLIPYKGWMAFGPRATEKWARFREVPYTLFARKGKGYYRLESSDGHREWGVHDITETIWFDSNEEVPPIYLSRSQYWTKWHIQLQWPLFVAFHIYWRLRDVPSFPDRPREDLSILHMFQFQIGFKRDADKVYWLTMGAGGRHE